MQICTRNLKKYQKRKKKTTKNIKIAKSEKNKYKNEMHSQIQ